MLLLLLLLSLLLLLMLLLLLLFPRLVVLRWQSKFGAIVLAIEGGQAAGLGFADVVTGAFNPSGALPFTMYATHACVQVPVHAFVAPIKPIVLHVSEP